MPVIDRRGGKRDIPKREIPADFDRVAKEKSTYQLVKLYRTSEKVIRRWASERGITLLKTSVRPVPENWGTLCASHTAAELTRLLQADIKVIKRWVALTEIEPVPYDRKTMQAPPPRKSKHSFKVMGSPHKAIINTRPRSIWDDAADVLRSERWIVYRCDEKGSANPKGMYWRMGNVILTPDDLLMRADRYRRRAA